MGPHLRVFGRIPWLLADDEDILPNLLVLEQIDHPGLLRQQSVLPHIGQNRPNDGLHPQEMFVADKAEDFLESGVVHKVSVVPAHRVNPDGVQSGFLGGGAGRPAGVFCAAEGDAVAAGTGRNVAAGAFGDGGALSGACGCMQENSRISSKLGNNRLELDFVKLKYSLLNPV